MLLNIFFYKYPMITVVIKKIEEHPHIQIFRQIFS